MFIVTPSTVWNPAALETVSVPKRMLGRISVLPRQDVSWRFIARLTLEIQLLRFLLPLVPFIIAMVALPDMALPISQAPLAMVVAIAIVEMLVLRIKPEKREALISQADMDRTMDALRFNATRLLGKIAARRGLKEAELMLVVEQSELARIAPLTLVSVQQSYPKAELLDLEPEERAWIADGLFDGEITEAQLQKVTLRCDENLHRFALDTSAVSAHARMAALMEARA